MALLLTIADVRDGFELIHHNRAGFRPLEDEFLSDPVPYRIDVVVHHATDRDVLEQFAAQYRAGFNDFLANAVGCGAAGQPWSRGYHAGLHAGFDEKRARTAEKREGTPRWFMVACAAVVLFIIWQSIALLGAAFAQEVPRAQACAERELVVKRLEERFGETRRGMGLSNDASIAEIFSSEKTGTWTILVTRPDGTACLLSAGKFWTDDAEGPGDPA